MSAPEILFERQGLPRDLEPGGTAREEAAGSTGDGAASTITATYGTKWNGNAGAYSGGNFVIETEPVPIEGNGQRESHRGDGYGRNGDPCFTLNGTEHHAVAYGIDQQGGKGNASHTENVSPTLAGDSHGTPHAVAYGISPFDSEGMKSANPRAGIYEADTSRTLDVGGGNPACNQGGMAIVAAVDVRNGKEYAGDR